MENSNSNANPVLTPSPTLGQGRVGVSFNPSGDERVNLIKAKAAAAIDAVFDYQAELINELNIVQDNSSLRYEKQRCFEISNAFLDATNVAERIETSAMWAVKGITKK